MTMLFSSLTLWRVARWWNEAHARVLLIGAGIAFVVAAALNATLIFDDLYLVHWFSIWVEAKGVPATIQLIFFGYDFGPSQYRLYGLSRVLHFMMWFVFGAKAWAYASLMALTQIATGVGIYTLLRRFGIQHATAACLGVLWVISPFIETTCFHHYSYLILPCQLGVACALVLQHRLVSALIGVAIALTGEAHLLVVPMLLIVVAFATPSDRDWRQRAIDAAVPIVSMALAAALHRWAWLHLVDYPVAARRYEFAKPTLAEGWKRASIFFHSLPRGFWKQGQAIMDFAAYWGVIFIAIASGAAAAIASNYKTRVDRNEALLPLVLLVLAGASIGVTFVLGVLTGQIYGDLPRRYGYVPNTLAVMTVFAALFAGRRFIKSVPAMSLIGATAGLFLTLHLVCLPVVRAQDRSVWRIITTAMKDVPYILYPIPGGNAYAGSAGIRASNFPEIFESPLMAYWWQSQYSVIFAGARFVGYQAIVEGNQAQLIGNGLTELPVTVSIRSVAVIEPVDPPPHWRSQPLLKISILGDLKPPPGPYPP